MNNIFEEHQYQRRLLPWLLVVFIWAVSICQIYNNELLSKNLVVDIAVLFLIPLIVTLLLFLFKLSIKVDKEYLKFKMFPFHWNYQKIKLDEIKNVSAKKYNIDRSFHGWGFGISSNRKHKSYTVKGYEGIEISLNDGKKIFIGTQQPESLIESLKI